MSAHDVRRAQGQVAGSTMVKFERNGHLGVCEPADAKICVVSILMSRRMDRDDRDRCAVGIARVDTISGGRSGDALAAPVRRFAEEVIPRFDVSSGEFVSRNFYDVHDLK